MPGFLGGSVVMEPVRWGLRSFSEIVDLLPIGVISVGVQAVIVQAIYLRVTFCLAVRCLPFELEYLEPTVPGRRIRLGSRLFQWPIQGVQRRGAVRIAAEWRCRSMVVTSMGAFYSAQTRTRFGYWQSAERLTEPWRSHKHALFIRL
jgi:hypothetical protein